MFSQVTSIGLVGLEGYRIEVETDLSNGLPLFEIVGLADTAVKEARERVRAAIRNTGCPFPNRRIIVNLSPADTRKEGSGFDLPIAIGILAASGILPSAGTEPSIAFCGELALDGSLRPVDGILCKAFAARESGCAVLAVPARNAREASLVGGLCVLPVETLGDLCRHLTGECLLKPYDGAAPIACGKPHAGMPPAGDGHALALAAGSARACDDFCEVRGQEGARRALEVAAAGGHHVLMVGTPGAGKTMLARRVAGILPDPVYEEALEITRIHSVAGLLDMQAGLVSRRPFRAPHHSISHTALIGGGRVPRPGEISLAHGGVLFLDELPEFSRYALDSLRQPLEEGRVVLSRVQATVSYPSRFMLIAAANPCKCGNRGDPERVCTCPPQDAERYFSRLSGPLLDRMDLRVRVPALSWTEAARSSPGESSCAIRLRVEAARRRQTERYAGTGVLCNAQLGGSGITRWCALDAEGERMLQHSFTRFGMSMRAHDRILRVARTIADLEGSSAIRLPHLAEALHYRQRFTGGTEGGAS